MNTPKDTKGAAEATPQPGQGEGQKTDTPATDDATLAAAKSEIESRALAVIEASAMIQRLSTQASQVILSMCNNQAVLANAVAQNLATYFRLAVERSLYAPIDHQTHKGPATTPKKTGGNQGSKKRRNN